MIGARWKYVVVEVNLADGKKQKLPIIFPAELTHKTLMEAIDMDRYIEILDSATLTDHIQHAQRDEDVMMRHEPWRSPKAVSAGFIADIKVEGVGGYSESLQLESKKGDDMTLINKFTQKRGLPG